MTVPSNTFLLRMPAGIPGTVSRSFQNTIEAQQITPNGTSGAPSAFGQWGVIDATSGEFRLPTTTDKFIYGMLARAFPAGNMLDNTDSLGVSTPPANGVVSIARRGYCQALLGGSAAATMGGTVYIRTGNPSTGKVVGQPEAAPDIEAVAVAGSNTGTGTFGALTVPANGISGAYALACIQSTTGTPAATYQASEGNTGTGTIGAITVTAPALLGAHRLVLTATGATAAFSVYGPNGQLEGTGNVASVYTHAGLSFTLANAGTMTIGDTYFIYATDNGVALFSVTDPNSRPLPNLTVGTAYSNGIAGTLSQGGTKFTVSDSFTVTVTAYTIQLDSKSSFRGPADTNGNIEVAFNV